VNHRLGNRLFFIGYVEECRLEGEREESVNLRGTEGELSATDENLHVYVALEGRIAYEFVSRMEGGKV
jgi:hypothetical protein